MKLRTSEHLKPLGNMRAHLAMLQWFKGLGAVKKSIPTHLATAGYNFWRLGNLGLLYAPARGALLCVRSDFTFNTELSGMQFSLIREKRVDKASFTALSYLDVPRNLLERLAFYKIKQHVIMMAMDNHFPTRVALTAILNYQPRP